MGVKFTEVIDSHDVEDQPAAEVVVWFNSVTDCFIMTQDEHSGQTQQICIYPRQMRELRDLLNRALEEDTPVKYKTGPLTMEKVFQQGGIENLSDLQAVLDRIEVVLGQEAPKEDLPQFYTCKGKGGRYMKVGEATGAGTSRNEGSDIVIYQDVHTGQLFKRTVGDFYTRMEKIDD